MWPLMECLGEKWYTLHYNIINAYCYATQLNRTLIEAVNVKGTKNVLDGTVSII